MNMGFRKVAASAGLAAILITAVVYFMKSDETAPDSHAVVPSEDQRINEFFEAVFEREISLSPVRQSSLGRKTDQLGKWDDISDNAAALRVDRTRADYDQLLANVADLPAAERRRLMLAGLNELVAAVQLGVKEHHGSQEEAVVSGIIKEAYRRLGVP